MKTGRHLPDQSTWMHRYHTYMHRANPIDYEILRIQQERLTGISEECLNMLANTLKMQINEYFDIF